MRAIPPCNTSTCSKECPFSCMMHQVCINDNVTRICQLFSRNSNSIHAEIFEFKMSKSATSTTNCGPLFTALVLLVVWQWIHTIRTAYLCVHQCHISVGELLTISWPHSHIMPLIPMLPLIDLFPDH